MTVDDYAKKYGDTLAYFGPLHIMTSDGNDDPDDAAFCITEMFAFTRGERREIWDCDPPKDTHGYIMDSLGVIIEILRARVPE